MWGFPMKIAGTSLINGGFNGNMWEIVGTSFDQMAIMADIMW
jgi:hypothetical protein